MAILDSRRVHDFDNTGVCCFSGPGPERFIQIAFFAFPGLPDTMSHIEGVQNLLRDGNYPEYDFASFFKRFKNKNLTGKIYPPGGQLQGFGNPASRVIHHSAKSADFSGCGLCRFKELVSFFGGEVKTFAFKVVELHIFGDLPRTTLIWVNVNSSNRQSESWLAYPPV